MTDVERFWRFVDQSGGPNACWPWTGERTKGYGYFTRTKTMPRRVRAHRWAYELLVGPIPAGHDLDHTCHNGTACPGGPSCPHRRCCNPAHLEPVTRGENVLRGNTLPASNAAKTECEHGHLFDEANTRIDPRTGDRVCRTCAREAVARWRQRQRA